MATNKPPPIVPKDEYRPWKPGDLKTPTTGNAASDVYRHLPSKWDAPPQPKPKTGK
jgi:hypothetical protein